MFRRPTVLHCNLLGSASIEHVLMRYGVEQFSNQTFQSPWLRQISVAPKEHSLAKKAGRDRTNPCAWPVRDGVKNHGIKLGVYARTHCAPLPSKWSAESMCGCKNKFHGCRELRGANAVRVSAIVVITNKCEVGLRAARQLFHNGTSIVRKEVIHNSHLRTSVSSGLLRGVHVKAFVRRRDMFEYIFNCDRNSLFLSAIHE